MNAKLPAAIKQGAPVDQDWRTINQLRECVAWQRGEIQRLSAAVETLRREPRGGLTLPPWMEIDWDAEVLRLYTKDGVKLELGSNATVAAYSWVVTGGTGAWVQNWRQALSDLTAGADTGIQFRDEDVCEDGTAKVVTAMAGETRTPA